MSDEFWRGIISGFIIVLLIYAAAAVWIWLI